MEIERWKRAAVATSSSDHWLTSRDEEKGQPFVSFSSSPATQLHLSTTNERRRLRYQENSVERRLLLLPPD